MFSMVSKNARRGYKSSEKKLDLRVEKIQCSEENLSSDTLTLVSLKDLLANEVGPLGRERAIEIIIKACELLGTRLPAHGAVSASCLQLRKTEEGKEDVFISEPFITTDGVASDEFSVYAAPELADGKIPDCRSDVYSLGVILYEMMSNKNASAVQLDAFSRDISKWLAHSPIWSQTPSALKVIIRRALHDEPCLRYANALELRDELCNFLHPASMSQPESHALSNAVVLVFLFLACWCIFQSINPPAPIAVTRVEQPQPEPIARHGGAPPAPRANAVISAPVEESRSRPLSPEELKILSSYDIVFMSDRSGSMTEFDCPLSGILTSRWDWVARQLSGFAKQTRNALPDGFSLVTFNDESERFDNCHETQIAQIFNNEVPSGGTRLAGALRQALGNRTSGSKPLAVVVLTDGLPNDQESLKTEVVNATNAFSKGSLRLLFLTVGIAPAGDNFLSMIDNDLVPAGAKSRESIITAPFRKMERIGLGHVIAHSITTQEQTLK